MTSDRWHLGKRPALDGIRGTAVLLVVITHFDNDNPFVTIVGGNGVTMFFTLSGFLITSLLLEELAATSRIDLPRFYLRRAFRLFPALIAVVLVFGILAALTDLTLAGGMIVATLTYVSNWYLLATASGGDIHWGILGHTWSLAVEEQFYLVWPLVLLAIVRLGRAVRPLVLVGTIVALAWGLLSGRHGIASDVTAWSVLAGCTLAVFMHGSRGRSRSLWVPAAGIACILALPLTSFAPGADQIVYLATPMATVAVIWTAAQTRVPWLEGRLLTWVGRRSYGLYLWHAPIAWLCHNASGPWLLVTSIGVGLSFSLTALSWHYIEVPLLNWRDRITTPLVDHRTSPQASANA